MRIFNEKFHRKRKTARGEVGRLSRKLVIFPELINHAPTMLDTLYLRVLAYL